MPRLDPGLVKTSCLYWMTGVSHRSVLVAADLLEVVEDRLGSGSIVITSQLPIEQWHDWLGEPTIADAILDRRYIPPTSSICTVSLRKRLSTIEETNT